MIPHETSLPGPAADFAVTLRAMLPVIETPRLRLRAPVLGDMDAWAEILCSDAGVFMGGPFSRDDAFAEFATSVGLWLLRGHGLWAVDREETAETIGFVLIGFEPGDWEPELGFLFRDHAQGHGYAAEAATAARDHGFTAMRLPSLVSYIAPDNARSIALARRLGATRDGDVDSCQVWRHHRRGALA